MMRRINDLYLLHQAALDKRSVVCPECMPWRKPHPAGFMINLQGAVLLRLFKSGMYLYKK